MKYQQTTDKSKYKGLIKYSEFKKQEKNKLKKSEGKIWIIKKEKLTFASAFERYLYADRNTEV